MSGHSKWSNIKRKKELTDGAKAKIFTKMGREISIAVKEGGADPAVNFKLATIIAKAKSSNVPNDNIDRAVKKAAGGGDKNEYEVIIYEGYGAGGVAFMVETMTDNRNRTAGDLRHFFDKFGGNLGQTGCVNYMFELKGLIVIEAESADESALMEDCIEAGAEDFSVNEDIFEITTSPAQFMSVCGALEKKGYTAISQELSYLPLNYTAVTDEESKIKLEKFIDILNEYDDVSNVWHNLAE